jgi:hypothetical protein
MNHLLTFTLAAALLLPSAGSAITAPATLVAVSGSSVDDVAASDAVPLARLADSAPTIGVPGVSPTGRTAVPATEVRDQAGAWHIEPRITFYGPGGHYGRRTACGQTLTTRLVGVATYLYPCGTKIEFQYRGRTIIAPVVDRGPARWTGFRFDLTGHACVELVGSHGACWTINKVAWRVVSNP